MSSLVSTGEIVSVVVVAPASTVSLDQVSPPFVDTCHCTVGAGSPHRAPMVKVAVCPAATDCVTGSSVMHGTPT